MNSVICFTKYILCKYNHEKHFIQKAPQMPHNTPPPQNSGWSVFTNHGHVLICLAQYPDRPLRDVAIRVGITERAVQRIVSELESGGYITRHREGRTNHYEINKDAHLRHPIEEHCTIGKIIRLINRSPRLS